MSRNVYLTGRALRGLKRLSRQNQRRVTRALRTYAETEHGDVVPIKGSDPQEWRLRVSGIRVIYRLEDDEIVVTDVLPRDKAYRVREPEGSWGDRIRGDLERVPNDQRWRVEHLVRGLVEGDRTLISLASAPEVDVSEEEREAIRAGSDQIARGEGIPLEEFENRIGR